jgi:molybdate transport system substrate-binding protein
LICLQDAVYATIMKKILVLIICLLSVQAFAQPLRVAVAANAQFVIKVLQADFKRRTGIETETVIGSSGKLSAQIRNGAPYDFFLSADMEFPENLFKSGFAATKPKEYASGSLIICSATDIGLKDWQRIITKDKINKIAIGNPAVAPYGQAAEQALRYYRLWDTVKSKLVYGESISQVNTYITSGTVPAGFTTEALLYESKDPRKLKWVKVDPKSYQKISQGMIVLNYSKKGNHQKAMKFYNYLSSPSAQQILKNNGYQVPKA